MPEIDEEVIFVFNPTICKFTTLTDGDTLILSGLDLSKEQAASIAYLINSEVELAIDLKKNI